MIKKSGFTLVELLISMGIMTILIAILAQVFGAILLMRTKNEAVSALAQDARFVVQRLSYDMARSSSIASPTVGNASDSLTLVISGVNYTYALQNNSLMLTVGAGNAERINSVGTRLTSLSFSRNDPLGGKASVGLDLTLLATTVETGVQTQSRIIRTTLVTP
ncbi:MAG: type II secretion system protein [bacterium]